MIQKNKKKMIEKSWERLKTVFKMVIKLILVQKMFLRWPFKECQNKVNAVKNGQLSKKKF